MNYAVVYLGGILFIAGVYWIIRGKKFYTGPLVEADINEDDSQADRSSDEVNHKTEKYGQIVE